MHNAATATMTPQNTNTDFDDRLSGDRLTNAERDTLNAQLERDGYAILPRLLPSHLMQESLDAIERIAAKQRETNPELESIKMQNCVDADAAFRHLMMYEPALQLSYDAFGPMFHLNQSNLIARPRERVSKTDFIAASPWHADGPRPKMFPDVGGVMGMHYLKFGYFLSDLTHGNGGSLQVVRGSHKKPELDGRKSEFRIEDYAEDFVQVDCPAGTIVAFHQAQWHAAPPNESDVERLNVYISYCPTWMRPLDREFPSEAELIGLSPEERWLLGEPRAAQRWWLPQSDDAQRMARFARDNKY